MNQSANTVDDATHVLHTLKTIQAFRYTESLYIKRLNWVFCGVGVAMWFMLVLFFLLKFSSWSEQARVNIQIAIVVIMFILDLAGLSCLFLMIKNQFWRKNDSIINDFLLRKKHMDSQVQKLMQHSQAALTEARLIISQSLQRREQKIAFIFGGNLVFFGAIVLLLSLLEKTGGVAIIPKVFLEPTALSIFEWCAFVFLLLCIAVIVVAFIVKLDVNRMQQWHGIVESTIAHQEAKAKEHREARKDQEIQGYI